MVRKKPGRKRSSAQESRWGFRGMTVRDWLPIIGALLIPVVIAVGSGWITWQQGKIEDQRAKGERELAEQRAQDEALQAYFDQMGALLLEKGLRESEEDSEVRTLARARTLTVLGRLDPSRKTAVMQFLVEAELVQSVDERGPIIGLSGSNLSGANLSDADLIDADLGGADLIVAPLSGADLSGANLSDADLIDAYLRGVYPRGTDLSDAPLSESADLGGADLIDADLSGAEGITNEDLERQARSLEGATMPNDQKYEEWLKSRGRREDGENSGPS